MFTPEVAVKDTKNPEQVKIFEYYGMQCTHEECWKIHQIKCYDRNNKDTDISLEKMTFISDLSTSLPEIY